MTNTPNAAVDGLLSMAQNLLRIELEKTGQPITPETIETVLSKLMPIVGADLSDEERESVLLELIRRSSRSVGQIATLSSGDDHIAWLNAERKKGWNYWRRYREYLEPKLPWSALDSLDEATDEILGNLEDPRRPGPWDRRGLVVGHVQSGKTGNYTGLICKAADAGYKIIIVLAGMHNNLRSQTQTRLEEGFLGYAAKQGESLLQPVGVGLIDGDQNARPNTATDRSERGDFNTAIAKQLNISPEQRPWLFVVKKQKTVLELLIHWIRNRVTDQTDPVTGRRLVTNLPLLVIDDESDHGSVDTGDTVLDENGNPDTEHQPTTINRLIRTVLHHFTRKAYVGYTATPFANIFIHDRGETVEHGPDLFPAAFITSLAAPSNYMGPGQVFGSDAKTEGGSALVKPLADGDFSEWVPKSHKSNHRPRWKGASQVPDSLAVAVRSFIYACAVRTLRGQGTAHSSMLVHVTRFTNVQSIVQEQIAAHVRDLRGRFIRGLDLQEIDALMREEYEAQFVPDMHRIHDAFGADEPREEFSWPDVRAVLPDVLDDIRVRTINGTAGDVLDYTEHNATGLKVIAIGGDKLARGLTLEGLCTSYFLRTARMYDTLMQMGRWFGYRDGYLDVCRLYTTGELIEWFGHIADAAEELRQEFDNMAAAGATPKQFGLRVKSHSVLTVTSRTKMRHARPMRFTYAGDLLQTIVFPNVKQEIGANYEAGDRFVESLGPSVSLRKQHFTNGDQRWNGHLWRDVPALEVVSFLRSYKTHRESIRVMSPLIADFIEEMNKDGELTNWTVALIGKEDATKEAPKTLGGLPVTMLKRGRSADHRDRYSVKTLISPRDQAIDLTEAEWKAALALTQRTWRGDKDRNQEKDPPTEPNGPQIRRVLGEGAPEHGVAPRRDRGLLMLYLLDPDVSGCPEIAGADPVVAWAISFPTSDSSRTVSNAAYMGNSVLWEELNAWVD
jgi:hypothetical protein